VDSPEVFTQLDDVSGDRCVLLDEFFEELQLRIGLRVEWPTLRPAAVTYR
jgi:hypothetical protein